MFKAEPSTTYGIRTRDSSVKGRRLNPLTNAALFLKDGKDTLTVFGCQIFLLSILIQFYTKKNPAILGGINIVAALIIYQLLRTF